MKFLTPLVTQKSREKAGDFIVAQDFVVRIEHEGFRYVLTVPKGFITDFASVPRIAQLLPGFGKAEMSAHAAVVHDFLYCSQGRVGVQWGISGTVLLELTRQACDQQLYDGLRASGYSRPVAAMFYTAVRAGGWLYWIRRRDGLRHDYDFVPNDFDWSKP